MADNATSKDPNDEMDFDKAEDIELDDQQIDADAKSAHGRFPSEFYEEIVRDDDSESETDDDHNASETPGAASQTKDNPSI